MLQATFIEGSAGRLLVTVHRPAHRGKCPAVLICPAFGDEMNKTRRTITQTAIALCEHGVGVAVPDVFGTGDSEGEFRDAGWATWGDDLSRVSDWAIASGLNLLGIVGVRTGALLAAQLASTGPSFRAAVMWQPVQSGRGFLRQLLRMRVISQSVQRGIKENTEALLERILDGESILVGGYHLTSAVVKPLVDLELAQVASPKLGSMREINVAASLQVEVAYDVTIGNLHATRIDLPGQPYWNSTETVVNQALVTHTRDFLIEHFNDAN